jgi:hypothetical protein
MSAQGQTIDVDADVVWGAWDTLDHISQAAKEAIVSLALSEPVDGMAYKDAEERLCEARSLLASILRYAEDARGSLDEGNRRAEAMREERSR